MSADRHANGQYDARELEPAVQASQAGCSERRALAPGGLLLYETFTTAQAARGKPTNPDFLLEPGELVARVAPLEVLRQREGDFEGRMVASVAARKAAG